MKRSIGVTISAIIVFLGSGITILLGVLILFASSSAEIQNPAPLQRYAMYAAAMFYVGLAVWGFLSGAGLLRLRNWARLSLLVYSGLLLLVSLSSLIMVCVMHFPVPSDVEDPDLYARIVFGTRIFLAIFASILIGLSVFWLYLFNTKAVREQFKGALSSSPPRRPVSITVIGWYLLVGAVFFPGILLYDFPLFISGIVIQGWSAKILMLCLCILQVAMGIGLLRLQSWARVTAIGYFTFFALNSVVSVLVPGAESRLQDALIEVQGTFGSSSTFGSASLSLWLGVAFAVPLGGVLLWFLVKSKRAFVSSPESSAP